MLALNGWAAHRLGRRLGGTEAAGALAGVAFMLSEPVAREANLHHAPQAMLFFAPLYLDCLLELRQRLAEGTADGPTQTRLGLAGGLWLAGAALSYWYMGLFLVLGSLPLVVGLPARAIAAASGPVAVLCTPFLLPFMLSWGDIPLTSGEMALAPVKLDGSFEAIPDSLKFVAQHGNDPLFWLRRTPLDTANRLSIVLLVAAVLGARKLPAALRWRLLFMVGPGRHHGAGALPEVGRGVGHRRGHGADPAVPVDAPAAPRCSSGSPGPSAGACCCRSA